MRREFVVDLVIEVDPHVGIRVRGEEVAIIGLHMDSPFHGGAWQQDDQLSSHPVQAVEQKSVMREMWATVRFRRETIAGRYKP